MLSGQGWYMWHEHVALLETRTWSQIWLIVGSQQMQQCMLMFCNKWLRPGSWQFQAVTGFASWLLSSKHSALALDNSLLRKTSYPHSSLLLVVMQHIWHVAASACVLTADPKGLSPSRFVHIAPCWSIRLAYVQTCYLALA